MFNKKKKEEKKNKKKKSIMDKVVMGAILGGAIGSVVGITVAPKPGKETRQDIVDAKNKFMDKHGDEIETVKQDATKQGKRIWKFIKKNVLKDKNK